MNITFYREGPQIENADLDAFETKIGYPLPTDYRQHMLMHNGGIVNEDVVHKDHLDGGEGIAYFYALKAATHSLEEANEMLKHHLPKGYITIGITNNHGEIILSLKDDETYGHTQEYFSDGDMISLSPSFAQLLADMREEGSDEEE